MMEGSFTPSSLSTPTPASSSAPATARLFKPRKSEDWNKYRPFIEQLYRNDQLKLKDVKNIMERDHRFTASEKQYKDRLSSWNIRKNIKAKEVRIMYRKQQKRAAIGKQTVFRVAGQKVDTKRIARFVRRYGTNIDSEHHSVKPSRDSGESPEPSTPSDMSYYTPEPDERPTSLSLSPHPESDVHPYDSLDPNSEQHDGRPPPTNPAYQLYDADGKPLKPIPPIANDPQGAYTMYNRYIAALGARLDKETAPFRSIVDESAQHQY